MPLATRCRNSPETDNPSATGKQHVQFKSVIVLRTLHEKGEGPRSPFLDSFHLADNPVVRTPRYLAAREPTMRISTNLLALGCQNHRLRIRY